VSAALHHGPYAVAAWLFAWGLYGIVTSRHFVHLVLCLGVVQTSSYVLLTAIGYVDGGAAPVFVPGTTPEMTVTDPIVQAMMLTDVVVEATVLALLLALVVRVHERTGKLEPDALRALSG
jgi:multicomponent Na+:H+ antiporter subunit C